MKKNNFFNLNLPDKMFGVESAFIKIFLIPIPLIVVFLISLNLIIIPRISEIKSVSDKVKSTNSQNSLVKTKNNYLKSIDQVELEKNALFLDSAVLKENKAYVLTEIVRKIADNYSYYISSFAINPGEIKSDGSSDITITGDTNSIKKTPITVTLSGPKDKMLDLITALENSLPILFIDKFETKTIDSLTELNLTISSYYINNDTNLNTNNLSLSDLTLTEEESSLLQKLNSFNKVELSSSTEGTESATYKEYNRENPFSL